MFQTTEDNRSEKADSQKTIDFIDALQREKKFNGGARGGS